MLALILVKVPFSGIGVGVGAGVPEGEEAPELIQLAIVVTSADERGEAPRGMVPPGAIAVYILEVEAEPGMIAPILIK